MGFRVLGGFSLLIIIIFYLINLTSSYPVPKTFPSDFVQKRKLEDKIIYGRKIKGGANGGARGGSSHGNGNSGSSAARGGAAVIPLYAAGAAGAAGRNQQRQIHHGAANCNINNKLSNILMIILVYPLILSFLCM